VTPISGGREVFGFTATGEVDRVAFDMGFAAPAVSGVVPVRVDIEMRAAE
jgi:polyisoprenoid-binding protein YceI